MEEITCEGCKTLQKRIDSLNEGIKAMEAKISNDEQIINILNAEKVQWNQSKMVQEQIITQQLGNSDNVVNQLQEEIIKLKREMRAAGLKVD